MAVARVGNRLARYGRTNPGRKHLSGADVTAKMQRQYEHVLSSLREAHRYRTDAKRRQVAAATVRKLARNPDHDFADAERLAEEFHGRPAEMDFDVIELERYHKFGGVLGYLVELWILCEDEQDGIPIRFDYDINVPEENILVVAPNKHNIEFVGGDQSFDWWNIEGATVDREKDYAMVGPVYEIVYWADKHHLTGPKQQKSGMEYFHIHGEDGGDGDLPWLIFSTQNERMMLVGGSYTIEAEGITG